MIEIFGTNKAGTAIDRRKLRKEINNLYETATAEQKTILLHVIEAVEKAEPAKEEKK